MRQMPSWGTPLYAAMTIRDTMLEATKPEMMAAFVATATSMPRLFRIASVLSAHSTACEVHTVYSPPEQSASYYIVVDIVMLKQTYLLRHQRHHGQ